MKIEENYIFTDGNNIWRLLLPEGGRLVIETRETESKEVFFHCINVHTGQPIFENLQLDEKYWVGIETVKDGMIFFHKYSKPDMPGHKQLVAFEIETQKILWKSDEYTFLFYFQGKIYGYTNAFEGRRFYSVDALTGEFLEDLGTNAEDINGLREIARDSEDYSNFSFTQKLFENPAVAAMLRNYYPVDEIVKDVEFVEIGDSILFNYHTRLPEKKMRNTFKILDKPTNTIIFEKVINKETNNYAPDSFFLFKNLLLLLSEKKNLIVYNLSI